MKLASLLLVALAVSACDPLTVGEPEARAPDEAPPVEPDDELPCAERTRAACRDSSLCTLVAPATRGSGSYVCRPAEGNCEIALRQLPLDRSRCEDRSGCQWRDGPCYCACRGAGQTAVPDPPETEPCDCECSGGPPAGCAPR